MKFCLRVALSSQFRLYLCMPKHYLPFLVSLAAFSLQAQYVAVGLGLGPGWVQGEIDRSKAGPAFQIFAKRNIGTKLYTEISFATNRYSGSSDFEQSVFNDVPYQQKADFQLRGKYAQTSMIFGWNFTPFSEKKDFKISIFSGISRCRISAQATYTDRRDSFSTPMGKEPNPNYLASIQETYYGKHFAIPAGTSLHYVVKQHWLFSLRLQRLFIPLDDLDVLNSEISENPQWDRPYTLLLQVGYTW
jgi:hypothetical protein